MQFNVLTLTLQNFIGVFSGGFGRMTSAIDALLAALLGIDLVLTGLFWALAGGEALAGVFRKVLTAGFWIWIVQSFPTIAKAFVESLVAAGLLAGGGNLKIAQVLDPSAIAGAGLDATEPLVKKLSDMGAFDLSDMVVFGVGYLVLMGCYVLMAINLFLAVLEYYLFAAVVGILLPFGVLSSTRFLAEKAMGAVVAAGIKLMVLAFVTSAALPILTNSKFSGVEIGFNELWAMILTIGGITVLCWKAPGLAASLMAGAPQLAGSEMIRSGAGSVITGATFAAGAMAYAPAVSASLRFAAGVPGGGGPLGGGAGATLRAGAALGTAALVATGPGPGGAGGPGARAGESGGGAAAAGGEASAGGADPSLVRSLGAPKSGS